MELEQVLIIGTGLITVGTAFGGLIWKVSVMRGQLQSEIKDLRRAIQEKLHKQELRILELENRIERGDERGTTGIKSTEMKYQHLRGEVKTLKKQLDDVRFFLNGSTNYTIRAAERPDPPNRPLPPPRRS